MSISEWLENSRAVPAFWASAGTPEQEAWVAALLAEARTKRDLPALADPHALLIDDTAMENTFTAQPQQRNLQGRIFGGFLMRRAFELAHSAAFLFSASRPRTVTVDEIQFRAPVNVGDLLRFRSWVLRSWQLDDDPSKARRQSFVAIGVPPEVVAACTVLLIVSSQGLDERKGALVFLQVWG